MINISQQSIFSRLSIVLSSVCVLHCLSVPFIILLLPAMAQFMSSTFETILILSVIPLSAIGFIPTWLRHKNVRLMYIYTASLLLLLIGNFAFTHNHGGDIASYASFEFLAETVIVLLGAFGLAWVIYKNNKHTHVCSNPNHDHNHAHDQLHHHSH